MTPDVIAVLLAGAGIIAAIQWWFFLAGRKARAATSDARGVQEVTIAVEGGYEPSTVRVRAGQPVRLVFDRRERSSCSEEIVMPAFGVRRFLPAFEKTAIELTPSEPGTFDFTCGMSMLRGRLVVEAAS